MNKIRTKETLKNTLQLVHKVLYKTIEFQLLFKLFYIGVILFLINFLFNIFFDTTDILLEKTHASEIINHIPIISLFEYKVIFIVIISLFIIAFVYLVEKNTVLILTSEYYRNNFISSSRALFLSMKRTSIFIFRRLYEMRIALFTFIAFYVVWKIITIFTLPQWFILTFATILIVYGVGMFLSLLVRYTFTAFITYLNPKEKPRDFNSQLSNKFLHTKLSVIIIFYIVFIFAILLWLLFFYFTIQLLLHFSNTRPDYVSEILSFFIAFTIISVLIFFSLFKTIKMSLMTILYYQERNHQNKDTTIFINAKQPILSKNIYLAILTIFVIAFIGGATITSSIKPKTAHILNNAHEYIEQTKKEQKMLNAIYSKNVDIPKLTKKSLFQKQTALNIIKKIIFTYFAYIIDN